MDSRTRGESATHPNVRSLSEISRTIRTGIMQPIQNATRFLDEAKNKIAFSRLPSTGASQRRRMRSEAAELIDSAAAELRAIQRKTGVRGLGPLLRRLGKMAGEQERASRKEDAA